jgi:hypothetical protein
MITRDQLWEAKHEVFVADPEHIKGVFREILKVEPKTWKCPCEEPGCRAWVVYGRAIDDRIYFMSTQTFQSKPPYQTIRIENVEDIGLFLDSDMLPKGDMFVYRIWFGQGLKEAVLSA